MCVCVSLSLSPERETFQLFEYIILPFVEGKLLGLSIKRYTIPPRVSPASMAIDWRVLRSLPFVVLERSMQGSIGSCQGRIERCEQAPRGGMRNRIVFCFSDWVGFWEDKAGGRRFVGVGGIENSMHEYHHRGCNNNTTSRQKDCLSQGREVDVCALFFSSFQAFNQFSANIVTLRENTYTWTTTDM